MDGDGLMYDKPASPAWAVVPINGVNTYVSIEKVSGGKFIAVIESGPFYGAPVTFSAGQVFHA